MGVTGLAFQFTVDERVSDTGPTDVMDLNRWFERLGRLGQEVTVFNAQLKSFSPNAKTNTDEEWVSITCACRAGRCGQYPGMGSGGQTP